MASDRVSSSSALSALVRRRPGNAVQFEVSSSPLPFAHALTDALLFLLATGMLAGAIALSLESTSWPLAHAPRVVLMIAAVSCFARLATRVLSESLVALPPLGLQLEVVRGIRWPFRISLGTSRQFVPAEHYRDLVINEALSCWNVRYYIAVLTSTEPPIHVAFQNTLPPFPILLECYRTLHPLLSKS